MSESGPESSSSFSSAVREEGEYEALADTEAEAAMGAYEGDVGE